MSPRRTSDAVNASRPTLSWAGFGRLLSDLLSLARGFRRLVSLFDRLGFGHVLALLGRAVKM
jgi:hypothetical protein